MQSQKVPLENENTHKIKLKSCQIKPQTALFKENSPFDFGKLASLPSPGNNCKNITTITVYLVMMEMLTFKDAA